PSLHAGGLPLAALGLVQLSPLREGFCRTRVDRQEFLHDVLTFLFALPKVGDRCCVAEGPSNSSACSSAVARSERRNSGSSVVRAMSMPPTHRLRMIRALWLARRSVSGNAARNTWSM